MLFALVYLVLHRLVRLVVGSSDDLSAYGEVTVLWEAPGGHRHERRRNQRRERHGRGHRGRRHREVNLDVVAKGDTESAAVVVPADAAGPPHAEVVSYTNP